MASFDENGKYIKTNWKAGDKITATKLNKIEESIEAVNDNDISRHVEADARLDALEAKNVAHDKELTKVKNLIEDAKDAAELGDYEINSRMQFLEEELNEGIEEVHNVASTVDGKIAQAVTNVNNVASTVDEKIATAEVNIATQVNTAKDEMEAMVAEAESEMETRVNTAKDEMDAMVAEVESEMDTLDTQLQNSINDLSNATKYLQSAYSNGYYVLPGGITLQWGRANIYFQNSPYGNTYVNFPILYTDWVQTYVNIMHLNSENGSDIILSSYSSVNGISIIAHHYNDLSMSNENSVTVNWFAIGI